MDLLGQLTRVRVYARWNMLCVKEILFTDFILRVRCNWEKTLFSFAYEMGWL